MTPREAFDAINGFVEKHNQAVDLNDLRGLRVLETGLEQFYQDIPDILKALSFYRKALEKELAGKGALNG